MPTSNKEGYNCICEQGWTKSDSNPACTIDVNECNATRPHCSKDPEVSCINLMGSFMCGPCPEGKFLIDLIAKIKILQTKIYFKGFNGNGYYCTDINECLTNNGGCSAGVSCTNTRGSYQCGNCPPGFEGDGKTCTLTTGLSPSYNGQCPRPELCHPQARCVLLAGAQKCFCKQGFTGSGYGMMGCRPTEFNPCSYYFCHNGGTCIANGTVARCECREGFVPPRCLPIPRDPCLSNPCLNAGNCTRGVLYPLYTCSCLRGFTGNNCQLQSTTCGGIRNADSGVLNLPENPNSPYHNNARCAWLIRVNVSLVINVTFTKFSVEPASVENDCRFDWLQIHDGRSSANHMIGRFCGTKLPNGGNIISTHNVLYLWFRSDNATSHEGFSLSWQAVEPICGGEIEVTTHGTIKSPGSPGVYPPNRDCRWHIQAPPGKRLQLTFFTMSIESHPTCDYDFVAIYAGVDTDDTTPTLAKFCNTSHPEPLVTPTSTVTIYFHSDGKYSIFFYFN